ncbi:MAG: prepilin-type N-terminal cleavage/methylation domain-containing protein [Candidatus Buchananbacteria bacterium]
MKRLKNNQSGQSLIELIVSIAVITIGLFSVWFLFLVNFNAVKESEMRIVAANLAREGAEIVKNIRDSNWLRMARNLSDSGAASGLWLWDRGLADGIYTIDYRNGLLVLEDDNQAGKLFFDADGYYSSSATANSSPFSRLVTLASICCYDSDPEDLKCDDTSHFFTTNDSGCPANTIKIGINVNSRVTWTYSGQPRQLVVEDQLFNWR